MSKEEKPKPELLGLPYDRLKAGVQALKDLLNTGKFLVFLSRQNSVRLIGEPEDFRRAFAAKLAGNSVKVEDAQECLDEIRGILGYLVAFPNIQRVVNFVEQNVFAVHFEDCSEKEKSQLRVQLKDKTELVSGELLGEGLRERANRIRSAVGPCIEDLDVEVVSQRHENLTGRRVLSPFLRLRIRYSEGVGADFITSIFASQSGYPLGATGAKSFECECDESDIDLLLLRLVRAKETLLRTMEGKDT